ncbi:MAG TPA: phosphatase PAP2 family protein [Thermoanaerobaculia bacterium]|nr:phosphatase PAP2 family protein [Thermoanaerobaculia bacterium]
MMCLLMGWSRVALGHHYVSDVLMGAVLGALVAAPIAAM